MQKLFNKILLHVDVDIPSGKLLDKAIEIALQYNCTVHLLSVVPAYAISYCSLMPGGIMLPLNNKEDTALLETKMARLCAQIPESIKSKIGPGYSVKTGNSDEQIIELVEAIGFDLVLVDKMSMSLSANRISLNPDKIAQKTSVPVISVSTEKQICNMGGIVIPVTNFVPLRKILYGIYLAHANYAILKLLGIDNKTNDKVKDLLTKCFCLIRDNCNIPIQIKTIRSNNVAEALSSFAVANPEDMIIVNPGTQTAMPGFISRLTGNIMQRSSIPPVLTVTPV